MDQFKTILTTSNQLDLSINSILKISNRQFFSYLTLLFIWNFG